MCVRVTQLLDRNPTTRLGMPNSPHGPIRDHQFFRSIDWKKLERRHVEPPFKPKLVGRCRFTSWLAIDSRIAFKLTTTTFKALVTEVFS